MMRSAYVVLMMLLLVVGSASNTWAQANDDERFEKLIGDALRAYNEGDFDKALDIYFEAKVIHDIPEVDYSIARTYQEAGKCEAAEKFYKKVLKRADQLPEGFDAKVNEKIDKLPQDCTPAEPEKVVTNPNDGKTGDGDPTGQGQDTTNQDTNAGGKGSDTQNGDKTAGGTGKNGDTTAEPKPDEGIDMVGLGLMLGGGAIAAGGLVLDIVSNSMAEEHTSLKTDPSFEPDEEQRVARINQLEDDIATRKLIIWSLYGVGGAVLLTGIIVFAIDGGDDEVSPDASAEWTMQPTFGPDSAGLVLGTRW